MLRPEVLVFLGIFCVVVDAAPFFSPLGTDKNKPGSAFDRNNLLPYLEFYGYYKRGEGDGTAGSAKQPLRKLQRFAGINVTGILDADTIKLLTTQRCGRDDTGAIKQMSEGGSRRKRYTLQGTYWKKKDLTYRFLSFTKDLPEKEIRRIVKTSLDRWSAASTLKIREETDPTVPDENVEILISFAAGYHFDSYPFDGAGGTLAHAYYPHNNMGLSGDAHFDDDEQFTTGTADGINLDWVALHEFGHSVGLEHSNVRESVMYPWYKGFFEDIKLTDDDISGVQAIYGKPPPTTEGPTVGSSTAMPSTPVSTPTPTPEASTTTAPLTPSTEPPVVDICKLDNWDAVLEQSDGRTHVIAGDYHWILSRNLGVESGPTNIVETWKELVPPIDAAYTRTDGYKVFFSGRRYWIYNQDDTLETGPKPITDLGLPGDLEKVDAAFVYSNKKTYLFSVDKYWRYNEANQAIDSGYPRPLSVWGGPGELPSGISAVMTWPRNGRTYFFVGNWYFRLNDGNLKMDPNYPRDSNKAWIKCG